MAFESLKRLNSVIISFLLGGQSNDHLDNEVCLYLGKFVNALLIMVNINSEQKTIIKGNHFCRCQFYTYITFQFRKHNS